MPDLDAYLHYRVVDVSSIKELVRRWYPKSYYASPPRPANHRALGDTLDSIAEMAYYRDTVMVPIADLGAQPVLGTGVGDRYGRWRSARALEIGGRFFVSRLFLSPTPVHNSAAATEPAGPGLWFTSENLSYPCSMMGV